MHSRITHAVTRDYTTYSTTYPPQLRGGKHCVCTMKEVVFYYDLVCPFAYMASRLIEGVAQRTGARIQWKPVLLGKLSRSSE